MIKIKEMIMDWYKECRGDRKEKDERNVRIIIRKNRIWEKGECEYYKEMERGYWIDNWISDGRNYWKSD